MFTNTIDFVVATNTPHTHYYLLTEFAFRTVRYYDEGPEVRTELARSVRRDRGLNILQYEKQTRLINSLLDGQG